MVDSEKVRQCVFNAIDEFNEQVEEGCRLQKSLQTQLFGDNAVIDSLGLVNLIVTTEEKLDEELDLSISLADEKAVSQVNSPFRTVETLISYIAERQVS